MTEDKNRARPRRVAKASGAKKKAGARPLAEASRGRGNGSSLPSARVAPARRSISAEQRHRMIQEAAYYRAERASFRADPSECWLSAEREIDAKLEAAT